MVSRKGAKTQRDGMRLTMATMRTARCDAEGALNVTTKTEGRTTDIADDADDFITPSVKSVKSVVKTGRDHASRCRNFASLRLCVTK